MALHTDLPIYRTGVQLLSLAFKIQEQMPRGMKRSLGEKISQHCVEMLDRMALFAEWTSTTPPENVLEDQGDGWTFSTEFLEFCALNGLSSDWVWLGDAKSLVLEAQNAALRGRA